MTPTSQDCAVSKLLSHEHTSLLPAYIHFPLLYCLLHQHNSLLPLPCDSYTAVQQSHSHCLVYLLFCAFSVHGSEAVCDTSHIDSQGAFIVKHFPTGDGDVLTSLLC